MEGKTLSEVLGPGFLKKRGLPPYGKLPPLVGGGLLQPVVDPESPSATTPEAAIDARLATALAAFEDGDGSDPYKH